MSQEAGVNAESLQREAQARARRSMIWIALLFFTPFIGAWVLFFYFPDWQPIGRNNNGTLIIPPTMTPEVQLQTLEGEAFVWMDLFKTGKWTMVTHAAADCDETCWKNNYKMRQTHASLNKYLHRIQRVLLLSDVAKLTQQDKLKESYPGMHVLHGEQVSTLLRTLNTQSPDANKIYLVDYLGYVMMEYAADAEPQGIHKDMARLLKLAPETHLDAKRSEG